MRELRGLHCARCGSEFDLIVVKATGYSGPMHLPNLFCPFCGSRRIMRKRGLFFGEF